MTKKIRKLVKGQPCRVLYGQRSETLVERLTLELERASSRLALVFILLVEWPITSINSRSLNFETASPSQASIYCLTVLHVLVIRIRA